MLSRHFQFAWHASVAVHLLLITVLVYVAPASWRPPSLDLHRGVISISAAWSDVAHEGLPLHVHLPGVDQDHHHEHLPVAIHAHRSAALAASSKAKQHSEPPEIVDTEIGFAAASSSISTEANAVPKITATADASPITKSQSAATQTVRSSTVAEMPVRSTNDPGAAIERMPRPLSGNLPPPYPADALAQGIQGRVLLEVKVRIDGTAGDVKLTESSGNSSLDQAAINAVRMWRFSPAMQNGMAKEFTIRVPIRFAVR